MKHTTSLSLGLALLSAMGTAHAQLAPIDRSDRRAQRQQMMQGMTPEQRAQYFQNQRQQRRNAATPEQRARMDANRANGQNNGNGNGNGTANGAAPTWTGRGTGGQGSAAGAWGGNQTRTRNGNTNVPTTPASQEARMRAMMNTAGITDKAQQDPIVAFVFAQAEARKPLLKTAQRVANSLGDGVSTPDQITLNWTEYQGALKEDKARFTKDLASLDEKIGYSKNPRLQSFLSLVGVLSPDASVLGEVDNIFATQSPTRTVSTARTQNG